MMTSNPLLNVKDFPDFVRFTHKMLAIIKYDVIAYVTVSVKRMLRNMKGIIT